MAMGRGVSHPLWFVARDVPQGGTATVRIPRAIPVYRKRETGMACIQEVVGGQP